MLSYAGDRYRLSDETLAGLEDKLRLALNQEVLCRDRVHTYTKARDTAKAAGRDAAVRDHEGSLLYWNRKHDDAKHRVRELRSAIWIKQTNPGA